MLPSAPAAALSSPAANTPQLQSEGDPGAPYLPCQMAGGPEPFSPPRTFPTGHWAQQTSPPSCRCCSSSPTPFGSSPTGRTSSRLTAPAAPRSYLHCSRARITFRCSDDAGKSQRVFLIKFCKSQREICKVGIGHRRALAPCPETGATTRHWLHHSCSSHRGAAGCSSSPAAAQPWPLTASTQRPHQLGTWL